MPLARRATLIEPSETLAITAKAKALRAAGKSVINLAAGEPDFDTPPHITAAAKQAIDDGKTKYTPASGLPELREAVVRRLSEDRRLSYTPQQVIITCGAKHAIANALQVLCQEGDEVLIPSPYWVSYPPMVHLTGAAPKWLMTTQATGFKITPQQLREALTAQSRVLILNSPSNPTGSVYSRQELEALGEVVLSHPTLLVLSDEIYEHLVFAPHQHHSIAALGRPLYQRSIVVSGVSKTYAMTGWRIGYLAASQEIADGVDRVQSHTTSNPASISQYAALAALTGPQRDVIQPIMEEFTRRRDLMVERVARIPGWSCRLPGGAFYVFCNIAALQQNAAAVGDQLLDQVHVAAVPGNSFGSPAHLRLSFATDQASIVEGMTRIERWMKERACLTS